MICKWCSKAQDDFYYQFCNVEHQLLHYVFIECRRLTMNHPFVPSKLSFLECAKCRRDVMAHGKSATCESCNNKGECDLFDNVLMCNTCRAKAEDSVKNTISQVESTVNDILETARKNDLNIRVSGDIFNAATVSHNDIKVAIENDDSIPQNQKIVEYQKRLVERFEHFQKIIFEADTAKHEASMNQLAITKSLRDLGNELREEFREKLRIADNNYKPIKPIPVVKVKKVALDPFERMAQNYQNMMAAKNILITLDQAKEQLMKNMKG
jgi:hypothetical protein